MRYPIMAELPVSRSTTENWMGYNHNPRIDDGEMWDMTNMTSDRYPVLSPRARRKLFPVQPASCTGLIAKDALCWVDGSKIYINGHTEAIDLGLDSRPKTLISMGAYVVIMPDKKYVNTKDTSDHGSIEASVEMAAGTDVTLYPGIPGSHPDTQDYYTASDTAPKEKTNGMWWLDTSGDPNRLKTWNEGTGEWVERVTTYFKLYREDADFTQQFKQYDGVRISGLKDYDPSTDPKMAGKTTKEMEKIKKEINSVDGYFVVWEVEEKALTLVGLISGHYPITAPADITIDRRMPDMDFIIESQNRLWGCRYGTQDGTVVNELYACKLGDFRNWRCYMGVSTDSYTVSLGTDGGFTGAITHMGYPIFFKRDHMHKVYGSYPAQYQVQDTACRGVQAGSGKSLAIVDEVLYYKSERGICAYDGSLPQDIGDIFGEVQYRDAVAGGFGSKYYVCMRDKDSLPHLFCYDAAKRLWHREDNEDVTQFCSTHDGLYYLTADGKVKAAVGGDGAEEDGKVGWSITTGIIGISDQYGSPMPDEKYIGKITLRLQMMPGAEMGIEIDYDSSGAWEDVATISCTTLRSYTLPIKPRRCDHLRLRLSGEGDVRIFSLTKTIEGGSDRNDSNGQQIGGRYGNH